jgi:TPP-dependent 2-oxoacid decarboxylase
MPRKAKSTEPETKTTEAPKMSKKAAIKAALKANPKKSNQEISELLKADGWDAKPTYISVVKSNMKGKKRKKAKPAPVAEVAAPAVPKDAVSVALMQKAKKLAAQLGGVKAAKQAIDALAQLLD